VTTHLQFLLIAVAGWVNRHQQALIEYLQEENQVLLEQLGGKPRRFTDPPANPTCSQSKGRRTAPPWTNRYHRHSRHLAPLVPCPHRQEVDLRQDKSAWAATGGSRTRKLVLKLIQENPYCPKTRTVVNALLFLGLQFLCSGPFRMEIPCPFYSCALPGG
jgi:hypothetical protein